MINQKERAIVVPFQYGLQWDNLAGGVTSALVHAAKEAKGPVTFLSADTRDHAFGSVQVKAVDPLADGITEEDLRRSRFSKDVWPALHDVAWTSEGQPQDVLDEMFQGDKARESKHPIGSIGRLIEFQAEHGDALSPHAKSYGDHHADRYETHLKNTPANSVVRYQDFFAAEMIARHADELRDRGCEQTLHIHSPITPNLRHFAWGVRYLEAIAKLDAVYVHTAEFGEALAENLQEMELRVPEIELFHLGADLGLLEGSLSTVNALNFEDAIPRFGELPQNTQEFISDVFRTQGVIPHRFMCVDRGDPIKSQVTGLRAIDAFLGERQSLGEDLHSRYRFYFLSRAVDHGAVTDPMDTAAHYGEIAGRELRILADRYPGVVLASDALKSDRRIAIGAMMRGCHAFNVSSHEGLNLAVQENAHVNREQDTAVIVGPGAGISLSVVAQGIEDSVYIPTPASSRSIADIMHLIVDTSEREPGKLRSQKDVFIRREVDARGNDIL